MLPFPHLSASPSVLHAPPAPSAADSSATFPGGGCGGVTGRGGVRAGQEQRHQREKAGRSSRGALWGGRRLLLHLAEQTRLAKRGCCFARVHLKPLLHEIASRRPAASGAPTPQIRLTYLATALHTTLLGAPNPPHSPLSVAPPQPLTHPTPCQCFLPR